MLAKLLAVVGGVDDAGVLGLPGRVERREDSPDVVVQEGDHPVVGRYRLADRLLVHRLVERLNPPLPDLERVL